METQEKTQKKATLNMPYRATLAFVTAVLIVGIIIAEVSFLIPKLFKNELISTAKDVALVTALVPLAIFLMLSLPIIKRNKKRELYFLFIAILLSGVLSSFLIWISYNLFYLKLGLDQNWAFILPLVIFMSLVCISFISIQIRKLIKKK